ncbi:amidohydrolase family protein [Kitasatospora cineracea]|uniref:amidohydrolase family protein n=1 Tax=Kitasatospora cineracea TaxID=88074 RepID=UPI0033CF94E8
MSARSAEPAAVLWSADRLVTGRDRNVVPGGAVLTRGARIVWVGPASDVPADLARGAVRRHFDGATLLPGLIDAHTHLALDAGTSPFSTIQALDAGTVLAQMRERARAALAAGVTTVRDLGAPWRLDALLRREILDGRTPGPTVVAAGVPLTVPGGHLAVLGGETATLADAQAVIRANRDAGCRWTKIVVTGGFTSGSGGCSPYASAWDQHLLEGIVAFSHAEGMPVAAHAHGTAGIQAAAAAGADSIEHATWMCAGGFDVDALTLADLARRGTAVCTTLNSAAPRAAGRLPWSERARQLRAMHHHRVPLAVGTDCGIPGTAHTDLPVSLPAYRGLGLDPLGVIELATSTTARLIGEHSTGELAPGRRADVLAVEGDPATDLEQLTRPLAVLARGCLHPATSDDRKKDPR